MARAQARPVVAVEILLEQEEIPSVGVLLELSDSSSRRDHGTGDQEMDVHSFNIARLIASAPVNRIRIGSLGSMDSDEKTTGYASE